MHMMAYTFFLSLKYKNSDAWFPNFGAARTPYLMYDIYTNDSKHGLCFPTLILHGLVFVMSDSKTITPFDWLYTDILASFQLWLHRLLTALLSKNENQKKNNAAL